MSGDFIYFIMIWAGHLQIKVSHLQCSDSIESFQTRIQVLKLSIWVKMTVPQRNIDKLEKYVPFLVFSSIEAKFKPHTFAEFSLAIP